jgi:hypothetical protein
MISPAPSLTVVMKVTTMHGAAGCWLLVPFICYPKWSSMAGGGS